MLSEAEMLAQRFNYVDTRLSEFAGELNTRMANMTDNINALAVDIAQLNESIVALSSGSRGAPNDLLDRRDQAITDLSELIGVQKATQEDGSINVLIGKGSALSLVIMPATAYGFACRAGWTEPAVSICSKWRRVEVTAKLTGGELAVLDVALSC